MDLSGEAWLDALVARIVPSDDGTPGAREAGVARYVGQRLSEDDGTAGELWRRGSAALEAAARSTGATSFAGAPVRVQDKALAAIDADTDLAGFLDLVIGLVREGMFADPAHGGNDDGIGWALIGYPGPRASWTENEQELT